MLNVAYMQAYDSRDHSRDVDCGAYASIRHQTVREMLNVAYMRAYDSRDHLRDVDCGAYASIRHRTVRKMFGILSVSDELGVRVDGV
jgi:hypothetical protein